jgi:quinol monooxygenase YgiN
MASTPVTVLIEYRALPEQIERAVAELDALIATVVRLEEDCFGIQLLQDDADPARILLYELWSSREAYEGPHFQTPHLQAFIARARDLFAGPPVIQFWHLRAEHSA